MPLRPVRWGLTDRCCCQRPGGGVGSSAGPRRQHTDFSPQHGRAALPARSGDTPHYVAPGPQNAELHRLTYPPRRVCCIGRTALSVGHGCMRTRGHRWSRSCRGFESSMALGLALCLGGTGSRCSVRSWMFLSKRFKANILPCRDMLGSAPPPGPPSACGLRWASRGRKRPAAGGPCFG